MGYMSDVHVWLQEEGHTIDEIENMDQKTFFEMLTKYKEENDNV